MWERIDPETNPKGQLHKREWALNTRALSRSSVGRRGFVDEFAGCPSERVALSPRLFSASFPFCLSKCLMYRKASAATMSSPKKHMATLTSITV